jgi:hypothetical protein
MHFLVGIEEEFEADHGQEGAAEAGNADMGFFDIMFVEVRLGRGEADRFRGPRCAAIATIATGKTIRIPKTAIRMPQVRKRGATSRPCP